MGLLRFLFAVSIIIVHVGSIFHYELINSKLAIQSFFVLSGFYMALILNEKYIGENSGYKIFISNRFLRIFPLYWTILFLTIILSGVWYFLGYHDLYLGTYLHYLVELFGQNKIQFGLETIRNIFPFVSEKYFINAHIFGSLFMPQPWTLGIEFLFYFLAPFIVRRNMKTLVIFFLACIVLRIFVFFINAPHNQFGTDRFFAGELVFFMIGILSYKIYAVVKKWSIKPKYLFYAYSIMILFTIFYTFLPRLSFRFNLIQDIYMLFLFCLIPFMFLYVKKKKIDRLLGELSYPMYISHVFVVQILSFLLFQVFSIGKMDRNLLAILSIVLTIAFSYVLLKVIDEPIDAFRQARLKAKKTKI